MRGAWVSTMTAAWLLGACGPTEDGPARDEIRQPSGLAMSPDASVLLVTNGNWDRRAAAGTLTVVDMAALDAAMVSPGAASSGASCRTGDEAYVRCSAAAFIDAERTTVLGDGVGNIVIDRPAGNDGPARVLIPVASPPQVVWLDLLGAAGDAARVDCGQDDDGRCDDAHRIQTTPSGGTELPGSPARLSVGDLGDRFAYLPHLLGGSISLISLDGEAGPQLSDVVGEFYKEDVFEEDELSGGFAVARRPCDPDSPPVASRDCTRPLLYSTHRYFPGMREFTVAPGRDRVLAGHEVSLEQLNATAVEGRPFMADLAFEDETGAFLLAVATTPAALIRIRTEVDEAGVLTESIVGSLPLCANPNALALYRPPGGEPLALVACRAAAAVAVVGLSSFRVLRTVDVGEGPSEVIVDPTRAVALVANTDDDSVSVIGLDSARADYLAERTRIGR